MNLALIWRGAVVVLFVTAVVGVRLMYIRGRNVYHLDRKKLSEERMERIEKGVESSAAFRREIRAALEDREAKQARERLVDRAIGDIELRKMIERDKRKREQEQRFDWK